MKKLAFIIILVLTAMPYAQSASPENSYWQDLESNLYYERKLNQISATYHFDNLDNRNAFSNVFLVAENCPSSEVWNFQVEKVQEDGFQYPT
jgi:hypothetical protein